MTPEMKKISLEALRSGTFQQYHGTLHNDEETAFCCIGVMGKANGCMMHNSSSGTAANLGLFETVSTAGREYLSESGVFLVSEYGQHLYLYATVLYHLNDVKRWSFNQIADFLEVAV